MRTARRLLAEERADLVACLCTLGADEWDAASLCEGWRVRDVVAHLDSSSLPSYLLERRHRRAPPGHPPPWAVAGRRVALDELDGDGVDLLRSRIDR